MFLIILIEVIIIKRPVLFLLILFIFLVGCQNKIDFLSYQDEPCNATLLVNNKFELFLSKNDSHILLTINKPSYLSGVQFKISENSTLVIYDNTEIPVNKDDLKGILAIASSFSLEENMQISVSDEGNECTVSFKNFYGTYYVTYNKRLLPQKIQIVSPQYEYDIEILDMKLASQK